MPSTRIKQTYEHEDRRGNEIKDGELSGIVCACTREDDIDLRTDGVREDVPSS